MVAETIAGKLNQKLNYTKQEKDNEQDSDAFKVYEEELEINDFPQQARWRVTSKVNRKLINLIAIKLINFSKGNYQPYL